MTAAWKVIKSVIALSADVCSCHAQCNSIRGPWLGTVVYYGARVGAKYSLVQVHCRV